VDFLGSITGTTNVTTGAILNTYRYKPYGAKLAGGTIGLGFFWTGNTGSRSTGRQFAEQYNRARHYSSVTGQWTTRDMLWPMELPFGYANLDPISKVDPYGYSPNVCPPDLSSAQRMIEAAFKRGGACAARSAATSIMRACPYIAAAIAGWMIGRFIDEQCGISDRIIECLWPSEMPVEPGTIRDPKQCTREELASRQAAVDKHCKDKSGKQRDFGCRRFKNKEKKRYEACVRELTKCLDARNAVCECYYGGCDEGHEQLIERLLKQI
jgi:RHS repeat-associated protein